MSGNGKQSVPGQPQRYPSQRDAFHVPGGVSAGYGGGGAPAGHLARPLPPSVTPPQQQQQGELKAAPPLQVYGQGGVRAPPTYQHRGPQQAVRAPSHHRPPMFPSGSGAPGLVFNMQPMMYPTQYAAHAHSHAHQYQRSQQQGPHQFFAPNINNFYSSFPQQGQQYIMPNQQPQTGVMALSGPPPRPAGQNLPPPQQPPQQHLPLVRYPVPGPHMAEHPALIPPPASTPSSIPKKRTFAIEIIDPVSMKPIVPDDGETEEEKNKRNAINNETSAAVAKEFAKLVSEAANNKTGESPPETSEKIVQLEPQTYDPSVQVPRDSQSSEEVAVLDKKPDRELTSPEERPRDAKRGHFPELTSTPVVSAISNSPEIVLKQGPPAPKQKPVEPAVVEKKTQILKSQPEKTFKTSVPAKNDDGKSSSPLNSKIEDTTNLTEKSESISIVKNINIDAPEKNTKLGKDAPGAGSKVNQKNVDEASDPPLVTEVMTHTPPQVQPVVKAKQDSKKNNKRSEKQEIEIGSEEKSGKKQTRSPPSKRSPSPVTIEASKPAGTLEPANDKPAAPAPTKQDLKKIPDVLLPPFKTHTLVENKKPEDKKVLPRDPKSMDVTDDVQMMRKSETIKPKEANDMALPPFKNKNQAIKKPPKVDEKPTQDSKTIDPADDVSATPKSQPIEEKDVSVTAFKSFELSRLKKPVKVEEKVAPVIRKTVPKDDVESSKDRKSEPKVLEQNEKDVKMLTEKMETMSVDVQENNKTENEETPSSENCVDRELSSSPPIVELEGAQDTEVAIPGIIYNYKEDQWSPMNRDGKKCYDVNFLMQLRHNPNSKKKPADLVHPDILSDGGTRQMRGPSDASRSNRMQHDMAPSYARGAMSHGPLPSRKSQTGKQNSKGSIGAPGNKPVIQINLSLRSDVKLNETENAWKPSRLRANNKEEEDAEVEELFKTFRSILNKLTPQKFDILIGKVRLLKIDTRDRLAGVIDLVFEKALDEPNFSVAYAQMCKELEQINVQDTGDKVYNFRKFIIERCQGEFEKEDRSTSERQKQIDECTDPEKKKELQLLLEEEERKNRRRSVGNVKFIGELFKKKMISSKIIMACIERLLRKIEEETLECLCKLLTTIGKDLEGQNLSLKPVFDRMQNIVTKKDNRVSSRIRFMLQDVIDLRAHSWVPRQQVSNPKTMDQIKLEAEQEQRNANYNASYNTNFFSPTSMSKKDDRPSNMNKRGGSKSVTEDGWQTTKNRSKPPSYTVVADKLKMMGNTPITQTLLQPSHFNWSGGSTTHKKADNRLSSSFKPSEVTSNSRKNTTETSNTYSLLDNQTNDPLEPTTTKRGTYQPKGASIEISTFKTDLLEKGPNAKRDEIARKLRPLMVQSQSENVYGVLDKITTNFSEEDMPLVIQEVILWGIEFDDIAKMALIGELTGRLTNEKLIKQEEFLSILKKIMDESVELICKNNNKHFWKMLVNFVWGHLSKNSLNLRQLYTAFSQVVINKKGFEFLTHLCLEKIRNSNEIKSLWENSGMTLSEWMTEDQVDQFLEELPVFYNINCTNSSSLANPEDCSAELLKLMKAETPCSEIASSIDKELGPSKVAEPWFIQALTEAVYTYTLISPEKPKPSYNEEKLLTYYPLLKQYVRNQPEQELQCLYALQRLLTQLEHPQGITLSLFEQLFESGEVISTSGFLAWEQSSDTDGKGVMLKQLTAFYTNLKSNDESSNGSDSECE